MVNKDLCNRIKIVRQKLGFNKSEFARQINLCPSVFSDIERYKVEPSKEIIKFIIVNFRINGYWLFTGKGEMFQKDINNNDPDLNEIIYELSSAPETKKLFLKIIKSKKAGIEALENLRMGIAAAIELQKKELAQ